MPDAQASRAKARRVQPPATKPVQIAGPFLDRVSRIPKASATLVTVLGELDGRRHLVPFLDVSFIERIEEDGVESESEAFAGLMGLDNAAHLLMLMGADVAQAVEDYETLTRAGNFAGESSMLAAMLTALPQMRESLEALTASLERLCAGDATSSASAQNAGGLKPLTG